MSGGLIALTDDAAAPKVKRPDLAAISAFLHHEAHCIDHRLWDEWIAAFSSDAIFWVPCWVDQERLTRDPNHELSLIYCDGRAGLEERVGRLRSGRSIASEPLQRTLHALSNIRLGDYIADEEVLVLSNAVVHSYNPRRKTSSMYFGHYEHRIRYAEGNLKIASKRVVLLNDYLPSALDIYTV